MNHVRAPYSLMAAPLAPDAHSPMRPPRAIAERSGLVPWPVPPPDDRPAPPASMAMVQVADRVCVAPFVRLGDYLGDLVREVQAEIAWLGTRREAAAGSAISAEDDRPALIPVADLTAADGVVLAEGGSVGRQGRTWTVATLATSAIVPVDQWAAIVAHAHARRGERTLASHASHPAHRLRAYEQQLGEPLACIARCMAVSLRPSNQSMVAVSERYGIEHPTTIEQMLNLLCPDPEDWLDQINKINPEHPLFAGGVCDWWRSGPPAFQASMRSLVAGTSFIAASIGRMMPPADQPGVLVIQPTIELDSVVLPPSVRDQAERLRLDPGRGTAALGILIHGPSGTGKTMLAHALAKRAGRRLTLIDPCQIEGDKDTLVNTIDLSLRRATVNGDIVCLDEVHHLLTYPGIRRLLLTALEETPAVVILVTTAPETLDSALDRRLPIRLHLDVPEADERLAILRQELTQQQVVTSATTADLTHLATVHRLTGGWWRSVVRLAAMRTTTDQEAQPVTAHHLHAQALLAQRHAGRTCWPPGIIQINPARLDMAGQRQTEIARVAAALSGNGVAPTGGGVLLVRGGDLSLIEAACVLVASALGRVAITVVMPTIQTEESKAVAQGIAALDGVMTPAVALLDASVLSAGPELNRLLRQASLGQHLIVVEADLLPPDASRESVIATLSWGVPLPEELAATWALAQGVGPVPACTTLTGVHAEAVRRRLGACHTTVTLP